MLFRVASRLGVTVERLLAEMPADEFFEWCAFYQVEPWGFDADNWRMSIVAATTANYSGRVKKPLKPSAFLPRRSRAPRKQSAEQIEQALRQVAVGTKRENNDD